MLGPAVKSHRRVAAALRRVLIIDPEPARARLTGELLNEACLPHIWTARTAAQATQLADEVDPDLIICEHAGTAFDGLSFTRSLRRSDMRCRKAPIVFVLQRPTATLIVAARDAGAHEFLRRPFTLRDLHRRLEAITLQPRNWVEAVDYVGPDRRRFNTAGHRGKLKRAADNAAEPHDVRIAEAVKIIMSAVSAIDREPAQALRALLAQTEEVASVAEQTSDILLATGVAELRRYLVEVSAGSAALTAAEILRCASAFMDQPSCRATKHSRREGTVAPFD